MATMTMNPGIHASQQHPNGSLNTLPDPRSPVATPDIPRSNSSSPNHPELSNEVATLSNKLIHAINHQTDLDDTLNETRHQLEAANERLRQLEHEVQEHRSLVTNGILIKRSDVDADMLRLKTSLAEERKAKFQVEKDKKSMEQELESLTTALFEEANQMVSNARKDAKQERKDVERRNEQLQTQLNDAELLLASHQEQLAELKTAMQQRTDLDNHTNVSSAPSTPALDNNEHMSKMFDVLSASSAVPAPPTSFSTLLHPVLRTDVQAYEDFHALLDISRRSQPSSRVNSGTYSGLAGLGLSNLAHREATPISTRLTSSPSTSSLVMSNNHASSPVTPTIPQSNSSSVASRETPLTATPLKETPFYKRILTEDLEPTLRLDQAPGLSWLARRGVISAMSDGKLVVEPMPNTTRLYQPPCSLCGEQGRSEKRGRKHKFRTSESEHAQHYPLCDYCLNRVRACCDFLGFLRMIKDGHWRTDGTEAESLAWEESVRHRERMFWSRIGGGVIPAFLKNREQSPRTSTEEGKGNAPHSHLQPENPTRANTILEIAKSERPSPLTDESPVDTFKPEVDISSPIDPKGSSNKIEQLSSAASPNIASEKARADPTPQDKWPTADSIPPSNSAGLARKATRPRGTSRGEATGRPSAAQTVAQRAAMFDRPTSSDNKAASNQLQHTLQASLRASIKHRSPEKETSESPISPLSSSQEHPPPLPNQPRSGRGGASETGSIPGSFIS